MLTLGLVINPLAGVGGPAAMKGSDGAQAQDRARKLGVTPQAVARARSTFRELAQLTMSSVVEQSSSVEPSRPLCRIIAAGGAMGEHALIDLPAEHFVLDLSLIHI